MKKFVTSVVVLCVSVTFSLAQYSVQQAASMYAEHTHGSLSAQDLAGMVITSQYTDAHNGVTHIYMQQRVNGIGLFSAQASMHIDRSGKVILLHDEFVRQAAAKANAKAPSISTSRALAAAGNEVGLNLALPLSKTALNPLDGVIAFDAPAISPEPIKISLCYVTRDEKLRLAFNVEVFDKDRNDWWNIRVDAADGSFLEKNNWVVKCNVSGSDFCHPYNFSSVGAEAPHADGLLSAQQVQKKASAATYNVFPHPLESPAHGNRMLMPSQATPNGSPFGWHDTDGVAGPEFTTTRGNNVFAREDTLAANGNGYSPDGTSTLTFDFPIDSNWLNTNLYLNAAITNLFYWNNILHDIFYNYGFNEVAGNYQLNNYGKGGAANDYVQADAQDGTGTNNANFASPADGQRGRMQMYLWPTATSGSNNLTINAPSALGGTYLAPLAQYGLKKFMPITANVAVGRDSSNTDTLGCGNLKNPSAMAGKIVLLYRGTCNTNVKVLNAQKAGAVAVIVVQYASQNPTAMTGSNNGINIPAVMVSRSVGDSIRIRLNKGDSVTVTLTSPPPVKTYDSDFDNGVIIHEYGHGVSIRLTGGPSNPNCLQNGEQAGEGWSDFFTLALTAKPGDKADDGRGIGTWVDDQSLTGLGIRTKKYSRSMAVNSFTYNSIKSWGGSPHFTGSVWATMLWDLYWDMVDKYGFDADIYNGTGGNNKTMQLVLDGLKLQKCSPGFVDARNAILQADSINNGGANILTIWKAFARRGLGYSALQGSTSSCSDGTEAFDLPPGINTGTGAETHTATAFRLVPNPTTGYVAFELPEESENITVQVSDISGRLVLEKSGSGNRLSGIDLSELKDGMYVVSVQCSAGVFRSKVLLGR